LPNQLPLVGAKLPWYRIHDRSGDALIQVNTSHDCGKDTDGHSADPGGEPRRVQSEKQDRHPLALRSPAELRFQADTYCRMAATARTSDIVAGLLRIAARFDALADQREHELLASAVQPPKSP